MEPRDQPMKCTCSKHTNYWKGIDIVDSSTCPLHKKTDYRERYLKLRLAIFSPEYLATHPKDDDADFTALIDAAIAKPPAAPEPAPSRDVLCKTTGCNYAMVPLEEDGWYVCTKCRAVHQVKQHSQPCPVTAEEAGRKALLGLERIGELAETPPSKWPLPDLFALIRTAELGAKCARTALPAAIAKARSRMAHFTLEESIQVDKALAEQPASATARRWGVSKKTTRTTRTGPKLRPRYCTFCGVKCAGAREAQRHCRKVGVGKGKGGRNGVEAKPDTRSVVGFSRGDGK